MKDAAMDVRFLLDRGYPKDSAVRFVSDHYSIQKEQRFVLTRVIVARDIAIDGAVATADGNIVDAATEVVDIPAEIAVRMGISPLEL